MDRGDQVQAQGEGHSAGDAAQRRGEVRVLRVWVCVHGAYIVDERDIIGAIIYVKMSLVGVCMYSIKTY